MAEAQECAWQEDGACQGKGNSPRTRKAWGGEDLSEGVQCLVPRSEVGQGGKGTGTLRENQINRWEITEGKSDQQLGDN